LDLTAESRGQFGQGALAILAKLRTEIIDNNKKYRLCIFFEIFFYIAPSDLSKSQKYYLDE
jgi:hypothetical protein